MQSFGYSSEASNLNVETALCNAIISTKFIARFKSTSRSSSSWFLNNCDCYVTSTSLKLTLRVENVD